MTKISRKTNETDIICEVTLEGKGNYKIDTKIGFFDHMLESFSKHSGIDIVLKCDGDIHVDFHHSVEDCGIVLGKALKKAIFPIKNCERFSDVCIAMDEAATTCILDLSNRAFLVFEVELCGKVGDFDVELVEEFFKALISNAGLTCHLIKQRGTNKHHIIESCFKAFAIALRRALNENNKVGIPSTKGVL